MTKIKVTKEGKLFIDDVEKSIDDLTPEFLFNLVDDSLKDLVDYSNIEPGSPLAEFFLTMKNETQKGAEFRAKIDENSAKLKLSEETIPLVVTSQIDDDLPF